MLASNHIKVPTLQSSSPYLPHGHGERCDLITKCCLYSTGNYCAYVLMFVYWPT